MAHWISAQGQLNGQKFKNMPPLWRHQEKTPQPNQIIFLNRNYKTCWIRGWFEQLCSYSW